MWMALAVVGCMMAPPLAPTKDAQTLGPIRVEQESGLQWPGATHPSFAPQFSRRWTHRLSLGFVAPASPWLEALRLDIISVGPSTDPVERNRAAALGSKAARPELRFEGGVLLPGPRRVRVGVSKTLLNAAGLSSGLGRGTLFVNGRL